MSKMESKERVANAFRAMKAIGISADKVKPVLKDLLTLYDKNWTCIEEENYRVLADTIFEREEANVVEHSKKNVESEAADTSKESVHNEVGGSVSRVTNFIYEQISCQQKDNHLEEEPCATEETERPLKRLRKKYRDDQSSFSRMPLLRPREEPNELPETHLPNFGTSKSETEQSISSKSFTTSEDCDPYQASGLHKSPQNVHTRSRGKGFVSPTSEHSIVPTPEGKSRTSCTLIKPKDEPVTDDAMPHFLVPVAVTLPDPFIEGNSTSRMDAIVAHEPSLSLSESENEMTDGTAAPNDPRNKARLALATNLEMASSSFGESKLKLSLSSDLKPGRQGFHLAYHKARLALATNLEMSSSSFGESKLKFSLSSDLKPGRQGFHLAYHKAFLQMVEASCLRSYKILEPKFPGVNLMEEICHSFIKIGSDLGREPPATINMTWTIDLFNKSSDTVGSLNDSVVSQLLLLPPCAAYGSNLEKMDGANEHLEMNLEKEESYAEQTNLSLVVVEQHNAVTHDMIKSLDSAVDITNGQEKFVITLVNEVNGWRPPSFYYIPKNVVFRNACVSFLLARIGDKNCCPSCSGDCLSLSKPCACALESGGEFAYAPDGLVKEEFLEECISMSGYPKNHSRFFCEECPKERLRGEDNVEPCKGHLVRKFIKECWWKCGCDMRCGNRVVQRGISCNLQVFMTPEGKGWGLRALADLPKGAFVCEYVGEILTIAELYDRVLSFPKEAKNSYPVFLDADWAGSKGLLKDDKALCLDATCYGNVGRFINHRCYDSNLVEIPVEVETPDRHYYHLAFFTTRKVNAMEELTWDYGIDFDNNQKSVKAFHCQCGSNYCRDIKNLRSKPARR